MGWTFSVGLIQQIQRFFLSQIGADPQQEIRPSQIFPDYFTKSVHTVYVDNFNEFRTVGVDQPFEQLTKLQRDFVEIKEFSLSLFASFPSGLRYLFKKLPYLVCLLEHATL